MKVGVLTYHRVPNLGSVMQAVCLQRLLGERVEGASVELVDYRSTMLERSQLLGLVQRRLPFLKPSSVGKFFRLRRIVPELCTLSSACRTDDLDEAVGFLDDQDYDALVVGSDTVWETRRGGNVPVPPNPYFLPGVRGVKKVAFAVSADPVGEIGWLAPARREAIRRAVEDFDLVFVRDEATRGLLEALEVDPTGIRYMPDPTLLVDFGDLVEEPRGLPPGARPLAGLAIASAALRAKLYDLLTERGYDVVNLIGETKDRERTSLPSWSTLGERLGVFASLDLFMGDRFHSTIFTLKLAGAPVVFVEHLEKWPRPVSKGRDLLRRLGLEDLVWRPDGDHVSSGLLDELIERSRRGVADLEARFGALRREAEAGLTDIERLLQTPPEEDRPRRGRT